MQILNDCDLKCSKSSSGSNVKIYGSIPDIYCYTIFQQQILLICHPEQVDTVKRFIQVLCLTGVIAVEPTLLQYELESLDTTGLHSFISMEDKIGNAGRGQILALI